MMKVPLHERPRERLLWHGPDHLSTAELIAIILGNGTKGTSVVHLADQLLSHFGGLQPLIEASISELKQIKGIGEAKAIQLKAAFGLIKRVLSQEGLVEKRSIGSARLAFDLVADLFYGEKQEKLAVLLIDTRLKLIHREVISVGTLSEVLIHPREIFSLAVRYHAHGMILAHNHPSGDPSPSEDDIRLTQVIKQCGEMMGISLFDHLVVAGGRFVSMKERGLF